MKLGYVKDLFATIGFLICIILINITRDLNNHRRNIISILVLAFILDGLFTINPPWHCEEIGKNSVADNVLILCCSLIVINMFN